METITVEVGTVTNLEQLKTADMEYIQLCIIEGRGLMGAAQAAKSNYRYFQKIRVKLYTIFDVTSESALALALVNNGIIKLK